MLIVCGTLDSVRGDARFNTRVRHGSSILWLVITYHGIL